MRHIYNITLTNNKVIRVEGKKNLVKEIKEHDNILKIEWYKSNGFWSDVTNLYIK